MYHTICIFYQNILSWGPTLPLNGNCLSPVHQNRPLSGVAPRHYWNFDSNDLCNPITYIWYLHNGFVWDGAFSSHLFWSVVVNQYCITRERNVDYFLTAILLRCFLASLDPIRIVSGLPCHKYGRIHSII